MQPPVLLTFYLSCMAAGVGVLGLGLAGATRRMTSPATDRVKLLAFLGAWTLVLLVAAGAAWPYADRDWDGAEAAHLDKVLETYGFENARAIICVDKQVLTLQIAGLILGVGSVLLPCLLVTLTLRATTPRLLVASGIVGVGVAAAGVLLLSRLVELPFGATHCWGPDPTFWQQRWDSFENIASYGPSGPYRITWIGSSALLAVASICLSRRVGSKGSGLLLVVGCMVSVGTVALTLLPTFMPKGPNLVNVDLLVSAGYAFWLPALEGIRWAGFSTLAGGVLARARLGSRPDEPLGAFLRATVAWPAAALGIFGVPFLHHLLT